MKTIYPEGDDTKGLPLFAGITSAEEARNVANKVIVESTPKGPEGPFDRLAKAYEGVEFSPDPIRSVIEASPLTVEQADALRRGETLPPRTVCLEPCGMKFGPSPCAIDMLGRYEESEAAGAAIRGEVPFPNVRLIDPKIRDTEEAPRISAQCRKILDRLREGTATNKELAKISLKYTGRISDLRAAGFEIDVIERDRKTGVNRYALREAR